MPLGGGLTIGATALNTGLGLAKYFGGKSDEKKAREEMARLSTPFYKIQQEYYTNRNLAESRAQQGFSPTQLNYLTTEGQRAVGTGIGALGQARTSPNDVSRLISDYTRSIGGIAAQDAQLQTQNIDRYIGANKDLAGQKTMQWSLNEYQPYQNKLKQLQERIYASKQNQFGGLSDISSSLSTAGTYFGNRDLLKRMQYNNTWGDRNAAFNPRQVDTSLEGVSGFPASGNMPLPSGGPMALPSYSGIPTPGAANPPYDYTNFNQQLFGNY